MCPETVPEPDARPAMRIWRPGDGGGAEIRRETDPGEHSPGPPLAPTDGGGAESISAAVDLLPPAARELYGLLRSLADAEGALVITNQDLARRMGLGSRGSISRHLNALRLARLIELEKGHSGTYHSRRIVVVGMDGRAQWARPMGAPIAEGARPMGAPNGRAHVDSAPTVGVGVERRREHAGAGGLTDLLTDTSLVSSRGEADQGPTTPEPEFDQARLAAARALLRELGLSFRRVERDADGRAVLAGDFLRPERERQRGEIESRWRAGVERLGPELLYLQEHAASEPADPPPVQRELPLAPAPDLEGLARSFHAVADGAAIAEATGRLLAILGDTKPRTRSFVERAMFLIRKGYLYPAEILGTVEMALEASPGDRGRTFSTYAKVEVEKAVARMKKAQSKASGGRRDGRTGPR